MRTLIKPGSPIETLTPDEARDIIQQEYRKQVFQHVRAEGTAKMDATGTGQVDAYTCPMGFEFECRRILIEGDAGLFWLKALPALGQGGPSQLVNPLEYMRSGESIGIPTVSNVIKTAVPQDEVWWLFPHLDTWGDQQGPYIRNGETLSLNLRGLINSANLTIQVTVEGLQRRPPPARG